MGANDTEWERRTELARLEHLQEVFQPAADEGSTQAGWLLIKIHESKAALLGLKLKPGQSDDEFSDARDELEEIRARRETRRRSAEG